MKNVQVMSMSTTQNHTVRVAVGLFFCSFALYVYKYYDFPVEIKENISNHDIAKIAGGLLLKENNHKEYHLELGQLSLSDHLTSRKKGIIVLSRFHSGSTFTGNFFNNHGDVSYIYEPLHAGFNMRTLAPDFTWLDEMARKTGGDMKDLIDQAKTNASVLSEVKSMIFADAVQCKPNGFWPLPLHYKQALALMQLSLINVNHAERYCHLTGPLSPRGTKGKKKLGRLNVCLSPVAKALVTNHTEYKELCQMYKHVAIKTIRAKLIDVIPLFNDPLIDVRVVHLIRDPRGWLRRAKAGSTKLISDVSDLCRYMVEELETSKVLASKYPNNYMLLRYEELDRDPVGTGKKLLRFTGLQETDQLKVWLDYEMRERNEVANSEMKLRSENWSSDLSAADLHAINTECNEYIRTAGYNQHPNVSTAIR